MNSAVSQKSGKCISFFGNKKQVAQIFRRNNLSEDKFSSVLPQTLILGLGEVVRGLERVWLRRQLTNLEGTSLALILLTL